MELLYEKEYELNLLRDSYISGILNDEFTLGYALQLGFNNIWLKLSNGDRIEVGYLYRNNDHLEYSGTLTDYQLSRYYDFVEYDNEYDEDNYGGHYTYIVVKCHDINDEELFKNIEK